MLNDRAGLKVGTDGVLLGAWAHLPSRALTVWDIGTGTGVVALMVAQRCDESTTIFGFEIDDAAADVADFNFRESRWSSRMSVVKGDVMTKAPDYPKPDMILCNPPYFKPEASLKAKDGTRDCARRGVTLDFKKLISLSALMLNPGGSLCLISPADASDEIEWEAMLHNLHLCRQTKVSAKDGKPHTRILWQFMKDYCPPPVFTQLYIRDSDGKYTQEYMSLTKDYYINL